MNWNRLKGLWVYFRMDLGSGYDRQAEENIKRSRIVTFVRAQLGDDYVYGAEPSLDDPDPKAYDCSELIQQGYCRNGAEIPDGAKYQRAHCRKVKSPLPADLAFFDPNANGIPHVIMYAGNDECIEARSMRVGGKQVGKVKMTPVSEVVAHPRFAGWYRHPDFALPVGDRA